MMKHLTKEKKTQEPVVNKITEGVIWKQLLLYFFPILMGSFFQQLYNTVDTVIVGRFVGTQALAAVGGSAYQITSLIFFFFGGLASGATVSISQYIGANDRVQVRRHVHCAYAFCIVGSVLFSTIGIGITPYILKWMNTEAVLIADATLYMRIFFGGILFSFIYNMGAGILRAAGDSKHPFYYLIICCFTNIILDLVFVIVFRMGVAGVAIATVLAQALSAALVTLQLIRSQDMLNLTLRDIRLHLNTLKDELRIGIPAGIYAIMYSISNIIVQTALNSFSTDTIAAYAAFGKLDAIYWMVIGAFGTAICTFAGQNYGAKKVTRIHKGVRISMCICTGISLTIALILYFGRYPLFRIFSSDPAVIELGISMLELVASFYLFYVPVEILSSTLRGMGDIFSPTLFTVLGICVLRVSWIWFVVPLNPTLQTVLINYPISWGVSAVMFIVYYFIFWKIKKNKFADFE